MNTSLKWIKDLVPGLTCEAQEYMDAMTLSGSKVEGYEQMDKKVKEMGSTLKSPYMTLSFMALLVIPDLKISDRGLFDVNKFELVPLFVDQM